MAEPPKIRLIPRWRTELTRLWSIRVGLFFGALNGAMLGLVSARTRSANG